MWQRSNMGLNVINVRSGITEHVSICPLTNTTSLPWLIPPHPRGIVSLVSPNSVQCPLRQLRGTEKQGRNTTPHWPRQSLFVKKTSIFVILAPHAHQSCQPRPSLVRTKITSAGLSLWFMCLYFCLWVGECLSDCACVALSLRVLLSLILYDCVGVSVSQWVSVFVSLCVCMCVWV